MKVAVSGLSHVCPLPRHGETIPSAECREALLFVFLLMRVCSSWDIHVLFGRAADVGALSHLAFEAKTDIERRPN